MYPPQRHRFKASLLSFWPQGLYHAPQSLSGRPYLLPSYGKARTARMHFVHGQCSQVSFLAPHTSVRSTHAAQMISEGCTVSEAQDQTGLGVYRCPGFLLGHCRTGSLAMESQEEVGLENEHSLGLFLNLVPLTQPLLCIRSQSPGGWLHGEGTPLQTSCQGVTQQQRGLNQSHLQRR